MYYLSGCLLLNKVLITSCVVLYVVLLTTRCVVDGLDYGCVASSIRAPCFMTGCFQSTVPTTPNNSLVSVFSAELPRCPMTELTRDHGCLPAPGQTALKHAGTLDLLCPNTCGLTFVALALRPAPAGAQAGLQAHALAAVEQPGPGRTGPGPGLPPPRPQPWRAGRARAARPPVRAARAPPGAARQRGRPRPHQARTLAREQRSPRRRAAGRAPPRRTGCRRRGLPQVQRPRQRPARSRPGPPGPAPPRARSSAARPPGRPAAAAPRLPRRAPGRQAARKVRRLRAWLLTAGPAEASRPPRLTA